MNETFVSQSALFTMRAALGPLKSRSLSKIRRQERLAAIEHPAGAGPLPRPFGPNRDDRGRWHRSRHTQQLEDVLGGIVKDEGGTVERNRATQRGGGRREQGIPVEAGDDGIVDVEKNATTLL